MSTAIQLTDIKESRIQCPLLGNKIIPVKIVNGIPYADFEKSIQWMDKKWHSGKVVFTPFSPSRLNALRYAKAVCVDSGINFKVLLPSKDKEGNQNFMHLVYDSEKTFDLTVKRERTEAFILSMQPFIEGNKDRKPAFVKMRNVDDTAIQNRSKRKLVRSAMNIIEEMEGQSLRDFARLLVIVSELEKDDVIKDRLEELAEVNPNKILQEWKQSDRTYKEVYKKAKDYNLIEFKSDAGFVYEGNPIGFNEMDVIKSLKDSSTLFSSIYNKVKIEVNRSLAKVKDVSLEMEMIAKIPEELGDQSMSDMHKKAAVSESLSEKGFDVKAMMEAMTKQIGSVVGQQIANAVNPLKESINAVASRQNDLDNVMKSDGDPFSEENKEQIEGLNKAIDEELDSLKKGIFEGKSFGEWSHPQLKEWLKENLKPEQIKPVKNATKADTFKFILNLRTNDLNNDGSGDNSSI